MKRELRKMAATTIYYSGIYWLWKKMAHRRGYFPIIFYHEISRTENKEHLEFSVDAAHFEKQLLWLKQRYNIVSLEKLIRHCKGEERLPGDPLAISFDGGYKGNYIHAFPILKKYEIPATVYLITDSIDGNLSWKIRLLYLIFYTKKEQITISLAGKDHVFCLQTRAQKKSSRKMLEDFLEDQHKDDRDLLLLEMADRLEVDLSELLRSLFLSWEDVVEMTHSPLIDIGSHTLTHPRLTDIPLANAEKEIVESKRAIESRIGEKVTSFCYPDGFFSEETIDLVQKAGYQSALAVSIRERLYDHNRIGGDLMRLSRIEMSDNGFVPLIAVETAGMLRVIKKIGRCVSRSGRWNLPRSCLRATPQNHPFPGSK